MDHKPSPIILVFYTKDKEEISKKSFVTLGEIIIVCRILSDFLYGQLKMIISGIGVGCFLIFLVIYLIGLSKNDDEQGGLKMGLILSIALLTSIFLKTLGSSFDLTSYILFRLFGWLISVFTALF